MSNTIRVRQGEEAGASLERIIEVEPWCAGCVMAHCPLTGDMRGTARKPAWRKEIARKNAQPGMAGRLSLWIAGSIEPVALTRSFL
ncbi:MAG: hypothetical protein LBL59_01950 [Xanthomonadaceae bacterium]|nr:hypothetical protein [Xanthomonadaceae bacterium]